MAELPDSSRLPGSWLTKLHGEQFDVIVDFLAPNDQLRFRLTCRKVAAQSGPRWQAAYEAVREAYHRSMLSKTLEASGLFVKAAAWAGLTFSTYALAATVFAAGESADLVRQVAALGEDT
jgi:hypothetical protein